MKDPYLTIGSFDRKNLFYGVKSFNRGLPFVDVLVGELISKFVSNAGSTIIYCTTIKDVEQIFKALQEVGIQAGIYHGQIAKHAREESHRFFITLSQIIVVEITLISWPNGLFREITWSLMEMKTYSTELILNDINDDAMQVSE